MLDTKTVCDDLQWWCFGAVVAQRVWWMEVCRWMDVWIVVVDRGMDGDGG